jgi:hypothetical protein
MSSTLNWKGLNMPQLIVRQLEKEVVKKLKQQADAHGISIEGEQETPDGCD